jgi:hypothetical protein
MCRRSFSDVATRHGSSNTRYLSSDETRDNAGIKGWKLHLSESTRCPESVGSIRFPNTWRAASLQPLTFSKHCSNTVFSNASPGLRVSFFLCEHRGFLKEGVKTYGMAPMSPLNSPTFFFVCTSIVYDINRPRATSRSRRWTYLSISGIRWKKNPP